MMKYLIYCGTGIGDVAILLPLARTIRKKDPNARITLFCRSNQSRIHLSRELIELQYDIEAVEYYSFHEPMQTAKFLRRIGYQQYDYAFVGQYTDNADTSIWPYRIVKLAAKTICGRKLLCHPKVQYDVMLSRANGANISHFFVELSEAAFHRSFNGIEYEDFFRRDMLLKAYQQMELSKDETPMLSFVLGTAPVGRKIKGKYIQNDVKKWPYENWMILAEKMLNRGYRVVLLGGKKEAEELQAHRTELERLPLHNLAGRCSLTQSLSVLNASTLVIGADTGLMHCAGALHIPSLELFGPTDPQEYLPYGGKARYLTAGESCAPCFGSDRVLFCQHKNCMKHITVESVFERACTILKEETGSNENQPHQ